jgi:tripartite-type tricarboxylate transporter receptor subunit TctC
MKLKKYVLACALAISLVGVNGAFAEYPEKSIEVVVGYSAGGGTDVMARTVAPFVEKYLGSDVSFVVKNVPGASGQIGLLEVVGSDADGYTLGTYNLPGMMARTLDREARYSADDFTFIANVVNDPNVLVTPKSSELDTLEKLIAAALEEPRAMTAGLSNLGGDDQFFLIKLAQATGAEFTIVPFRGSAPSRAALMGGHVGVGVLNLSEALKFQDRLTILGVATEERSPFAPDLPTFTELGYDIVNGSRRGFVGPADLPDDIRDQLILAFEKAFADPEFQAAMATTGNPTELTTGDDFMRLNNAELEQAIQVWEATPWK